MLKDNLKKIIQRNLDKHKTDYADAIKGYYITLVETHQKILDLAKKQQDLKESTYLPKPKQYIAEYERILRMLDATESDQIPLNEQDFSRYVEDQWDWKTEFLASSTQYGGKGV